MTQLDRLAEKLLSLSNEDPFFSGIIASLYVDDDSLADSLRRIITDNPPKIFSPIKPKHIKRLNPGLADDKIENVLELLRSFGIYTTLDDVA